MRKNDHGGDDWWRGAVLYHVYPLSFLDSTGDGHGDLPGVIERLDYIASLGVDGFWLSPFFPSPMDDFGYDVADYCDVHPVFGTLDDFDRLVERAHALGLRVVIDQVYSHTSDRHAWFAESRGSRDNARADWYVWANAREDGSPPNNWQSVFRGPAWTWDGRRRQYYLHNFLSTQPALNVRNPDVQGALFDVARFWLDRGVDGLRLDAINYSMHDPRLRDNPPAPPGRRRDSRPFGMQVKRYNTNQPDVPEFLERLREVVSGYAAVFTVAEVGGEEPLAIMQEYTRGDRRLHSAYGFDFLLLDAPDAAKIRTILAQWPGEAGVGWPSWAFSNHDAPRVVSRWSIGADPRRRARLFALLLISLRGNVFIYQGEELGLPQASIPFESLRDPEAIANWPDSLGRDGARTPMPWTKDAPHAGFSTAAPWLPVDPEHRALAVDRQADDPASVLAHFRRLLGLRQRSRALRTGDIDFLDAPDDVLAFTRTSGDERVVAVFNLGSTAAEWSPPDATGLCLVATSGDGAGSTVPPTIAPFSGYLAA